MASEAGAKPSARKAFSMRRDIMVGDPVAHERLGGADLQFVAVEGFQVQRPDPGVEHRIAQLAAHAFAHRRPCRPPVRHRFSCLHHLITHFIVRCRAGGFSRPVSCSEFALALPPGKVCGLPAIAVAAMAFAIGIAFKAARDIEGLGKAGLGQGDGGGAAARARAAQQQHRRVWIGPAPVPASATKPGLRAPEGKLCHSMQWTWRPRRGEVGQADKVPFRHGAHVHQLGLGVCLQALPGLGGADIAGIIGRRGRRPCLRLQRQFEGGRGLRPAQKRHNLKDLGIAMDFRSAPKATIQSPNT